MPRQSGMLSVEENNYKNILLQNDAPTICVFTIHCAHYQIHMHTVDTLAQWYTCTVDTLHVCTFYMYMNT